MRRILLTLLTLCVLGGTAIGADLLAPLKAVVKPIAKALKKIPLPRLKLQSEEAKKKEGTKPAEWDRAVWQ